MSILASSAPSSTLTSTVLGQVLERRGDRGVGELDDGWRDRALCRDTDPDLFFPVGTTGHALVQIEHAKQVCRQCNVTQDCLEYALATNQDSGIWGGLSEEERRVIRRRRAAERRAAG